MFNRILWVAALVVAYASCYEYYYYDETICENIQPGLWVRDTEDCTIAHQCGFDMEVIQSVQCNESQVWSNLASACVWEWDPDRDDCNGKPHTSILGLRNDGCYSLLTLCSPGDPRCIKKTGNNPHPDDCSKFLSCSNGTMVAEQRCSDGTLFWPTNSTCEFAQAVMHDCHERKIPLSIPISEEDPLCQENGQMPDPVSCQHFIQCLHGKRVQRIQCPRGTAFSDHSLQCEWYEEVHCGNRAI